VVTQKYNNAPWRRIKSHCPICGSYASWCTLSGDGKAINCPRSPNSHPIFSRKHAGEVVGYLHKIDGTEVPPSKAHSAIPLPSQELELLQRRFSTSLTNRRLERLAEGLGLKVPTLRSLGVGWCNGSACFTFPMRDHNFKVVGFRMRTWSGRKFSLKGGSEGLFIPARHLTRPMLLVCEGPTSLGALLEMGFDAIARPSCSGGVALLREYLLEWRMRDLVIVGDRDERKTRRDGSHFYPGQDGAAACAKAVADLALSVKVLIPPVKDVRDWMLDGATHDHVMDVIRRIK
jgi:hypothetical protein